MKAIDVCFTIWKAVFPYFWVVSNLTTWNCVGWFSIIRSSLAVHMSEIICLLYLGMGAPITYKARSNCMQFCCIMVQENMLTPWSVAERCPFEAKENAHVLTYMTGYVCWLTVMELHGFLIIIDWHVDDNNGVIDRFAPAAYVCMRRSRCN